MLVFSRVAPLLSLFAPTLVVLTLVGCTGAHSGSASNSGSESGSAQPLPADVGAAASTGDSTEFRSSDDPNLILPEPSSGSKTESTGSATKSRKPASTR